VNVTVAHCVRNTVDPIYEKLGATAQKPPHVIDFFPVPLAVIVFAELPHGVTNASQAPKSGAHGVSVTVKALPSLTPNNRPTSPGIV